MYKALLLLWVCLCLPLFGCEQRAVDYEQVSPEERIVVKFSHVVAETSPKGLAARRFANLVNERSEGRIEVQVYPNSNLYKDGEEIDALRGGNVQLIAPATAKMTKYYPQLFVFDLPFLFADYQHVYQVVDGPIGEQLMEEMTDQEMMALAFWDNGFKQLSAHEPILTKEDFDGLRVRLMDSELLVDQFRSVGAATVVLPFSDVYAALERQEANCIENSLSNIYTKRFYKVLPTITISNHGYLGYAVLANQEFWLELPQDMRELMEETLWEVTLWQREIAEELNRQSLEELKLIQGNQVHYLTPEQRESWRELFVPVYRKYQHQVGLDLIQQIDNYQQRPSP